MVMSYDENFISISEYLAGKVYLLDTREDVSN